MYVNPCLDFQYFKNGYLLWENGANAQEKLFFLFHNGYELVSQLL